MGVNWILVIQFPKPTNILKHTFFKNHYTPYKILILKKKIEMFFTHFALFIIFIKHQFKRFLKQNFCFVPFLLWPCITHPIYLVEKRKTNDPTIERGKIWMPFIKLGIRPTSTASPRRDQLVLILWRTKTTKGNGMFMKINLKRYDSSNVF